MTTALEQQPLPVAGAPGTPARPSRVSLALKLTYTGFLLLHGWFNGRYYGPLNYLWLCDASLLIAFVALWTESRRLGSMLALATVLPLSLWSVDFAYRIVTGRVLLGISAYMYDPEIPQVIRALSLFHGWLLLLGLYLVYRLGYDRRAWQWQTALTTIILVVSFFLSDSPGTPGDDKRATSNLNWVHGPAGKHRRNVPKGAYLLLMIVLYPSIIYLPTHLLLMRTVGRRPLADFDDSQFGVEPDRLQA